MKMAISKWVARLANSQQIVPEQTRSYLKSIAMAQGLSRKADQKKEGGSKNCIKRLKIKRPGRKTGTCKKGFKASDGQGRAVRDACWARLLLSN